MSTSPVQSRGELFDLFKHTIEGTYDELLEEQELDYKQNMLKTFLIESNVQADELGAYVDIQENREIDYDLRELLIQNGSDTPSRFFLDHEDDRFWSLYTLSKSDTAKEVVAELVSGVKNGLDYTWFPVEMQREFTEMGEFRGLGVKYQADDVFPEEFIEDRLSLGDLSVQGHGQGTGHLYEILESHEELRSYLSLSSVGIRREVDEAFVLERITHNGTFTTRGGNSAQLHLETVEDVRDQYARLLREIEENHRISYESKDYGTGLDGSPLVIYLTNELEDVGEFVENIVTATNPLRLWGAKTQLDDDYYKVKGIDLHNNDKYTLEVAPEWLRLYLGEDACGNTALRIYSHLQRYYDSEAEMNVEVA